MISMMFLIPILSIIFICNILFKHSYTRGESDSDETSTNDATENEIEETVFNLPASKRPGIQIEDASRIPSSDESVKTDNETNN